MRETFLPMIAENKSVLPEGTAHTHTITITITTTTITNHHHHKQGGWLWCMM
jgi:hypothetical protein